MLRVRAHKAQTDRGVAERQKRKTRRNQRGYVLVGALAIIVVFVLAWWTTDWFRQDAATLDPAVSGQGSTTSLADVSSTTTGGWLRSFFDHDFERYW